MAAAIVAALIVVVGAMISNRLLDIRLLTPGGASVYGSAATTGYAVSAATAALVATLLLYVLMLSTPEPAKFFGWIAGLFAVFATILPFMHSADLVRQIATGAVNLIIGIAIVSLLATVGRSALEEAPDPEPYPYEQRGHEQRRYERPREYERRGNERRDHDPYD